MSGVAIGDAVRFLNGTGVVVDEVVHNRRPHLLILAADRKFWRVLWHPECSVVQAKALRMSECDWVIAQWQATINRRGKPWPKKGERVLAVLQDCRAVQGLREVAVQSANETKTTNRKQKR